MLLPIASDAMNEGGRRSVIGAIPPYSAAACWQRFCALACPSLTQSQADVRLQQIILQPQIEDGFGPSAASNAPNGFRFLAIAT
jgi:hypothetical protein